METYAVTIDDHTILISRNNLVKLFSQAQHEVPAVEGTLSLEEVRTDDYAITLCHENGKYSRTVTISHNTIKNILQDANRNFLDGYCIVGRDGYIAFGRA